MFNGKIKKMTIAPLVAFFALSPLYNESYAAKIVGTDENVKSYFIGDYLTGKEFYSKNKDQVMPIASMSKLMTYLVIKDMIDEGKIDPSKELTASKKAEDLTTIEYSALGVKEGEKYSLDLMLEGLIVVSGNDCAVVLAEDAAGDEKEFAKLMNEKAKSLGLSSQHYVNASGIEENDGGQNSSSAKDVFLLSKHIIEKYPEILEYSKIDKVVDEKKDIYKNSILPLKEEIPGLDGLKTGTTGEAGYCLTSTVDMEKIDEKDKFRTIGVVMGADAADVRNLAMTDLIYYVSRYFDSTEILNVEKPFETVKANSAENNEIDLYPDKDFSLIVQDKKDYTVKKIIDENIKAPVKKGDKLGKVVIKYADGEEESDLIAKEDVKEASFTKRVCRIIEDACNFVIKCLISL